MDAVIGAPGRAETDRVVIRFIDDELLEGRIEEAIDLERPDFELILTDPSANNQRALIPLPSVKCVTLHRRVQDPVETDGMQKVALRFHDGEVLKGLIERPPRRARFGLVVELHSQDAATVETIGIPYDSLKAVFYLKSWNSRPAEYLNQAKRWLGQRLDTPLVELLGDIARLGDLRDRGELTEGEFQRRRRVILDMI